MNIIFMQKARSCDGCTKCCEGWLQGSVNNHDYFPGRKCFYLEKEGCSIYSSRPQDPCKEYQCAWISDFNIPSWMKPDTCGVIVSYRVKNGIRFVELVEAGEKLNVEVLSWFIQEYAKGKINTITYTINGSMNFISRNDEWQKICG